MNLKNMGSTEYQKGEKLSEFGVMAEPAVKTIMVNNLHWQKWCPDCGEWFDIWMKPPGTKFVSSLPGYCKICTRTRNDRYAERKKNPKSNYPKNRVARKQPEIKFNPLVKPMLKINIKKIDHRKSEYRGLDSKTEDVLLNGSFADFMNLPDRVNPYDLNDDWKKSKRNKL